MFRTYFDRVDIKFTGTMSYFGYMVKNFVGYITENETDVNNKKLVYDGLMAIMAANRDNQDEMKVINPLPIAMEFFINMAVNQIIEAGFTAAGAPEVGKALEMLCDAAGINVGKEMTRDFYKGEAYNFDIQKDFYDIEVELNSANIGRTTLGEGSVGNGCQLIDWHPFSCRIHRIGSMIRTEKFLLISILHLDIMKELFKACLDVERNENTKSVFEFCI